MVFNALRPVLRNFTLAVCYAYAMSVGGFVILWLLGGEAIPVLAWLTNILHILLLPIPLLLVLIVLLRQWRTVLLVLPLLAIWIAIFAPPFLPKSTEQPEGTTLRIATFNVLQQSTPELLEIIRAMDADVIALQELSPNSVEVFNALSDRYAYTALHPQDGVAGLGIYSRYPIMADEYRAIGNGQQRVLLDVAGVQVAVFNVHTVPPFSIRLQVERSTQVAALLDWSTAETGAVIVLGDFNMTPLTADYRAVTVHLADVFGAVGQGLGFTYPSWGQVSGLPGILPPLVRIDYVFISQRLLPLSAAVWAQSDSADHRPVVVQVAVR